MDAFVRGQSAQISSAKPKQSSSEASAGTSRKRTSVPWVEKYRPKSVDDVACQEEVVAVLKKTLEGADLSHLLFYGPPGTGKTSTILAMARQLYGNELMSSRVLELNASDERGIQVVRDKVKRFAQFTAGAARQDGKPCPPFKLVILDEADSMTPSAQAALRRTIEKQTKTTRFCLICNYVSRIIEPLTSRCSKFRFKPLATEVLEKRLKEICEMEEVKFDEEAIQEVVNLSEGDMRKAITFLQSAHRLKGEDGIHAEDITNIAGVVPTKMVNQLFEACQSNSYDKLDTTVKDIIAEGHSAAQIISQTHDRVVQMTELTDHQKSAIAEKLAIVDKCLTDGADEYLQILSLGSVMMQQLCHPGQT